MQETIVQPGARLDTAAVHGFEQQLAEASLLGTERVLVDLSQTGFITSLALLALLKTARWLASAGGRLVVFVAAAENVRPFAASGVDQVIPVHTSLAQARAALGG